MQVYDHECALERQVHADFYNCRLLSNYYYQQSSNFARQVGQFSGQMAESIKKTIIVVVAIRLKE